jgi:hypothetical protein
MPDTPAPPGPPDDLPAAFKRAMTKPARVMNLIGMGDPDRLREVFDLGADPNCKDRSGRPALVRAICGSTVEASIVRVLLEAGADSRIPGPDGLAPLERARRRLLKYEGKPQRRPRRSPSLTPGGEVRLHRFENRALDRIRETHPDIAEGFEADYLEARRKVAERVFDTRGNLEQIVPLLEAAEAGESLP